MAKLPQVNLKKEVQGAPAAAGVSPPSNWTTDQGVTIHFNPRDQELIKAAAAGLPARWRDLDLSTRATQLAAHPGYDRLICEPMVRDMQLLEHQTRAARTVLRRMRGRALLCDEVGLGKTVEAGLVLHELMLRGLVKSVLILTPPSLIEQWQAELRRKFAIETVTQDSQEFRDGGADSWGRHDRIVASFHTAKRSPHREAVVARPWDIVIIDEAHHFRNSRTQLWQMASLLTKRFVLLLTATPVQNDLEELFNLVTLLEPGLLSTQKQFAGRFIDKGDRLTPRNVPELHKLLSEVMVRNRRSTVGMQFTRRWARTERVRYTPEERELYDTVASVVRRQLRVPDPAEAGAKKPKRGISRMAAITLQMELGSSAPAAAQTLRRLSESDALTKAERDQWAAMASLADGVREHSKARRLCSLLDEFPDKMVVFTQFRATQDMLAATLAAGGVDVSVFHGGLSRLEKEAQVERFRNSARVLLTTDSGSEGRNLQFCNVIVNYDLPWNPMRIEQRIGRLSRIGQTRDVHVVNLAADGTIEAAVLHLLEAKLMMFELVIGEIDMVLGNLEDDRDFSEIVGEMWGESEGVDEFGKRLDAFGERLLAAKRAYIQQKAVDERIFGDQFRPEG